MKFATHSEPIWRSESNFIIMADLSDTELTDHWEQLWAKQVGDHEFTLCCIPFFTYGISLGDRVRTCSTGDREYVIDAVVARSGRCVYRIWLEGVSKEGRDEVSVFIKKRGLLHEWRSANLVAFDVPTEDQATQEIEPALEQIKSRFNVLFERGG